jgi:hypothetical protein
MAFLAYDQGMLLAALVLGAIALYYFGLRAGAWAALATLVLCLVALFVPRFQTAIYAFIAAGAFTLWRIGSRRPRPPDAVFVVRLVRSGAARIWSRLTGSSDDDRN